MSGYGEHPSGGYGSHRGQPPYGPDPYGPDPYGRNPHGQDPYSHDPYAHDPYAKTPYGRAPYAQDPAAWQDPYGSYAYDQAGYQVAPPGYGTPGIGYGPPGFGRPQPRTGPAIAALICNVLASITCYGFLAVPGIVTAAIAIGKAQTNPAAARKLTIWSWCIFAAGIVIGLLLVAGIFAYGISSDSGSFDGVY
jgi:hypothetical protein